MAQSATLSQQPQAAAKHSGTQGWETLAVALLLGFAGYNALLVAPTDILQGQIYRIIFFHVPSWWSGFVAFAVVLVANIAFLRSRSPKWDWLAVSSAELGVAFITVGLITGPIWAHPVWGIWWTWDARLTSAFVLWVLFVCYLLLRELIDDPERRAVVSAVFGIFACLDIPLVYFSIWFFRTQHPQPVIGDGGYIDPRMLRAMLVCWAALLGVYVILLRQRYRLEGLRYEVDSMRLEAGRAPAGSQTGRR